MNSFQLRQNSTIYTDLAVIQTIQWSFKPFVSQLLDEDPGLSIPSAVAILPDFDGFLPILSKLNYLDRYNRHPATKMPKLTLCLPPARWGPRALDSRCSGNIASFRWISSNLIETRLFTDLIVIWHLQCQNQPYVSHLLAEDPGPLIPGAVAILPDFDGLRPISSKLDHLYRFNRHPTLLMVVFTICLPPAGLGHMTLVDSQCSGNIARFQWISSNFIKTQLSLQI